MGRSDMGGMERTRNRVRPSWLVACLVLLALARPASALGDTAQLALLQASNTDAGDEFGRGLAISGETLAVGATEEDSAAAGVDGDQADNSTPGAGAVYIFGREGAGWQQEAYIKASNTGPPEPLGGDGFGRALALDGDTLVVSAPGEDSAATGVGGDQFDESADASGAVYVYIRDQGTWSFQAYLKASNTGDFDTFGWSLALSGDTLVVGSPREGSAATGVDGDGANDLALQSGAAYVFVRSGQTWSQQAYLKPSNTGVSDWFGGDVDISGDTIVVGAPFESSAASGVGGDEGDNSAQFAGAAYVFVRSGQSWSQQAYLKASNTGAGDQFGGAVAVDGDLIVVGARYEDSAASGVGGNQASNAIEDSGAAYVYRRDGTSWSQVAYLKSPHTNVDDWMGAAVAVQGDRVVVGAIGEGTSSPGINPPHDNSAPQSGAVYSYRGAGGGPWTYESTLKASNPFQGNSFGVAVALGGDLLVAGATGQAAQSGAAYLFDFDTSGWLDLGGGTAGAGGQPTLVGEGTLLGGTPASLTLTQAPPGALMLSWISFAPTPFEALGGTVHALPYSSQRVWVADGLGQFAAATTWPAGLPACTEVWFQFVVEDAGSPSGLLLSNGLRATTP